MNSPFVPKKIKFKGLLLSWSGHDFPDQWFSQVQVQNIFEKVLKINTGIPVPKDHAASCSKAIESSKWHDWVLEGQIIFNAILH